MKALNKESQNNIDAKLALQYLKEGNNRFLTNTAISNNLLQEVKDSAEAQFPFASIISCIDSRVPTELIFDQGIGDLFNAKVAGNIVNEDILGSIEYACHFVGTKLVVVLGHTSCGAVTAACQGLEFGNITSLVNKISPSVEAIKNKKGENLNVDDVAIENVLQTIERIKTESTVLRDLEAKNSITIIGAIYDVKTGKVSFM